MTKVKGPLLYLLPLFALMLLFLTHSPVVKEGVLEGLRMCLYAVIPSVFPFTIFACYLSSLSNSTTGGRWLPMITGLLCGFPLGAKVVVDGYQKGAYKKREAEYLLPCCNNTSLSFLVMGVGYAMRGRASDGVILFAIQATVSLFLCLIFYPKKEKRGGSISILSASSFSLSTAITQGVASTLTVCGFITYFSCILALCQAIFPSTAVLIASLFLEVSHGCQGVVGHPLSLPLTAFAIGFSGVSVHLQVASLTSDTDISLFPYFLIKSLSGVLNFVLACIYTFFS